MRTPFFSLFSSNIWKSPLTAFLLYPRVSRLREDHIPSCPSSSRLLSLSCHYVSAYIIKNKNKKHLNGSLFLHVSLFNIFSIKKKIQRNERAPSRHIGLHGSLPQSPASTSLGMGSKAPRDLPIAAPAWTPLSSHFHCSGLLLFLAQSRYIPS